MGSDKRVIEYKSPAIGILDVNGKSVAATNGSIMRLNRPHAVMFLIDVVCENDDGTVGAMDLEFDLYDDSGSTIVWTGDIATAISLIADLQAAVLFGGGVTAAASDGTIHNDASVLAIFDQIRFRVNVTTANDDTGTCVINVRAKVQE